MLFCLKEFTALSHNNKYQDYTPLQFSTTDNNEIPFVFMRSENRIKRELVTFFFFLQSFSSNILFGIKSTPTLYNFYVVQF